MPTLAESKRVTLHRRHSTQRTHITQLTGVLVSSSLSEPTFFIAGAQRCGTTWLYHLLDEHPDIFMAKPVRPEPKFFTSEPTSTSINEYRKKYFANTGKATAIGKKSTTYIEVPQAAHWMRDAFPGLKLIFLLRHPLERAISNYWFSRENGFETEPLARAFELESERLGQTKPENVSTHPNAYVHRGHYAKFLEPYYAAFSAASIHVVLLDDLVRNTQAAISNTYQFLSVRADFRPPSMNKAFNESVRADDVLTPAETARWLTVFHESNTRLGERLGRDLAMWEQ